LNKSKITRLAVCAGILLLCGFVYVSTMLPQDLKLRSYKTAFNELSHSENTRLVAKYSFLGALDTQRVMYKETYRQGCDYIVGEVREYTGSQESIEVFYARQTLTVEGKEKKVSVQFIPFNQDGHVDRYGWGEYGPNGDRLLANLMSSPFITLDSSKSLYFVFISYFKTPTSDIRCLL